MPREYFHAYHDYLTSIEPLGDAERGRLFTALLKYSATGVEPELQGNERFIFPTLAAQIHREAAAYDDKCKQMQANASKRKHKQAKASISREEEEEEEDKEEDDEEEEDEDKRARARENPARTCINALVTLFNDTCTSLPRVSLPLSRKCEKALLARYADVGLSPQEIKRVFKEVENSDFLCGRKPGKKWKADLEWILVPKNFQNIRAGKYADNQRNNQRYAPTYDIAEIERQLDEIGRASCRERV